MPELTPATEAVIKEEVPESAAAVKKLLWSMGLTIFVGVAQLVATVLTANAPGFAATVMQMAPAWMHGFAGPAITTGLLALATYLQKWAKADHKEAVATALVASPPQTYPVQEFKKH